ncbi:MAG: ABC transporter permease subunit [Fimbriimonas sp.]
MKAIVSRLPVVTALVVFILFCGATGLRHPNFLQPDVFWNILRDNAFLGIAAVGATYVILTGGIDLSVGAVIGLTSVSVSAMIAKGVHPVIAIAICLAGGAAFGATMGKIIVAFEVPPFLVTLAGLFMARGLAYLVSTDSSVISHPFYDAIANTTWAGPVLFLVVVLVGHLLLHFRPFGRTVYALGGNEASATLMGLQGGRTKVATYALAGFCSALGGIAYTFYTVSGDPNAAVTLELDAITAVVVGGTLLTGGYGSLIGTVIGVLLLGAIQTAITYEDNISSWWTRIVVGGLLLIFLVVQKVVEKGVLRSLAAQGRKKEA